METRRPNEDAVFRRALEGSECPPLEELAMAAEGIEVPGAAGLREHATACAKCAAELDLLREFEAAVPRRDEWSDVRWIERRMKDPLPVPAWWERFIALPQLGSLAAAAAALLLIVGGATQFWPVREPTLGQSKAWAPVLRSSAVVGLKPAGDVTSRPEELSWAPVAGASRYEVSLMEVDGVELWHASTAEARAKLPSPVAAKIVPAKTLVWVVNAFNAVGERIAVSGKQKFRLSI